MALAEFLINSGSFLPPNRIKRTMAMTMISTVPIFFNIVYFYSFVVASSVVASSFLAWVLVSSSVRAVFNSL